MGLYDKTLAAGERIQAGLLESGGWVALTLIVFLVQYFLCLQTGRAVLSVEIESSQPELFKVYWRSPAGNFREANAVSLSVVPGKKSYSLVIPSLFKLSELRIDPLKGTGTIAIRNMRVRQPLYLPLFIDFQSLAGKYRAIHGLVEPIPVQGGGVELTSTSPDPWLVVEAAGKINPHVLALWVATAVCAGFLLNFLLHSAVLWGSRDSGILQVEIPEGMNASSEKWHEELAAILPGLHLLRTTERAGWWIYQFAFARAASSDLEALVDRVQRHHPALRLHLQMNRSGEVS